MTHKICKKLFLFLLVLNLPDLHAMNSYYSKIYETLRPSHKSTEKILAVCIKTGSYFLADYIVNNTKVNLNYVDQEKKTFVHLAVLSAISLRTKCDFFELLFEHKININAQDAYGNTALHYACLQMSPEIMKILLKNGAHLDIPNNKSETARSIGQNNLVHPDHWKSLDGNVAEKHKTISALLKISAGY